MDSSGESKETGRARMACSTEEEVQGAASNVSVVQLEELQETDYIPLGIFFNLG